MQSTKNYAVAAVLVFATSSFGCSSVQYPTHRWEASASNSLKQYRKDVRTCSSEGKPRRVYAKASSEFDEYRACMEHSGYNLVALSDSDNGG